jgi:hypothetical protein
LPFAIWQEYDGRVWPVIANSGSAHMMAGAAHFTRVGASRKAESPAAGDSAKIISRFIRVSGATRAFSPTKSFRIDFS